MVKIYGPYPHRDGWRCYLRTELQARAWCKTGRTAQEALDLSQDAVAEFRASQGQTIGDLVTAYLDHMRARELAELTIVSADGKLRKLLGPLLDQTIVGLTASRAEERYIQVAATCAAATHQAALRRARTAWRWAVRRGLAKLNPWLGVEPVGRANRGKPQLSDDETKKLIAVCLADALVHDGALAILVLIFTGIRSSEILKRVVRDIDGNGSKLLIRKTKNEGGKRAPAIPDVIQPAIRVRIQGRSGDAPLLHNEDGQGFPRGEWLNRHLAAYCKRAGVPRVVPHALRGGWATFAYDSGQLSHAVAAHLGHASPSMTEAHYVKPESVEGAKQARRLNHLKSIS